MFYIIFQDKHPSQKKKIFFMNIFIGLSQSKSPKTWLHGASGNQECWVRAPHLAEQTSKQSAPSLPASAFYAETTQPIPYPADSIYSILFSKNGTLGKSGLPIRPS